MAYNFLAYHEQQRYLLPASILEWVREDTWCALCGKQWICSAVVVSLTVSTQGTARTGGETRRTIHATPALLLAGRPTLRAGIKSAWHLSPTMDTLITLGAGVSYATGLVAIAAELGAGPRLLNYAGVSAMIMAFHLTGRYIETIAKGRASQAIKRLLTLSAKTARLLRDEGEVEVPI